MKLKSLLSVAFLLLVGYSYGQVNILNAKSPEEIGQKTEEQLEQDHSEPLPYGYTNERDILWAKSVWEYIDLKQRVNFPYLYPIDTGRIGNERKSLYYVLVDNIKNGNIEKVYADSYFTREQSIDELEATLHRADTLEQGYSQLNAGEELDEQFIDETDVDGNDVQGYKIRGYWYFDKRQGDLRYRLLGIAPMIIDAYSKSQGAEDEAEPVELFWVFYPDARDVLFEAQVFNEDNSAHPQNFDELLNARRFEAVIYKTDNDHGDREIDDYIVDNSLKQLLESEDIKEEIREFEENMWNY